MRIRNWLLLPFLFSTLWGQAAMPTFEEGVDLFNRGGYWEALRVFSVLSDLDPELNPQLSASHYMRVRCYYQLGFNNRALLLAKEFPQEFPTSSYLDDMDFLVGEIQVAAGNPGEAAYAFARAAAYSEDKKVRRTAREFATSLIQSGCSQTELEVLTTRSVDRAGQFITILIAEHYLRTGESERAVDLLFNIRPFIHDEDLLRRAVQVYRSFRTLAPDTLHLALVLPLTGGLAQIGNELLDGMRYATMRFVDTTGVQVQFHIRDNAGDLGETIRIAREIRDQDRIDAILGPLTNENVKGAAAVLEGSGVPMLTPTASEDYLATLSPELFQFRATRERKAKALADYAVKVLGLHTFAIIAPSTEYGQQMADNFARRVDRLGGEILYQGWYVGEPTDLSTYHFKRIRELGIEEMFRLMEADTIPDTTIFHLEDRDSVVIDTVSEYVRLLAPILEDEDPTYSDSLKIQLSHVDGLFFPIHPGSIPYIASQFAHNNLDAYVLGDENWLDKDALRKNARYLPLFSLISGDRLPAVQEPPPEIRGDYYQLYRRLPGQYDYLGMDCMGDLLGVTLNAGADYRDLRNLLIHSANYEGVVHDVQWGGHTGRENDRIFLWKYEDREFRLSGFSDERGFFMPDSISAPVDSVNIPGE